VATSVLLELGVDNEALRQATFERLPAPEPQPSQVVSAGPRLPQGGRPVEDLWTDGLASRLGGLGGEIRAKLDRDPDAGDLLLALACTPGTLVERVLRDLDVDLDELWGRIEVARRERLAERATVEREIAEVARAKDEAIESQDFARAAELRDAEGALRERQLISRSVHAETLAEIRRRLGIPRG
jgi:hypothetical protein